MNESTTKTFRGEQRAVVKGMVAAAGTSIIVLLLLLAFQPFPMPLLPTPQARLTYTAQADILLFAWLGAGIANVARQRFSSAPDIGGSGQAGGSAAVARSSAILQNTLEQAVFAFGTHLALSTYLPARWMIVIPELIGLFCVGRICFWLGYKHGAAGRAFGFALTFYPSVAACFAAIILLLTS